MKEKIIESLQQALNKNNLQSALIQVSKNGETIIQDAIGTSGDTVFDAESLVEVVIILPAILKIVEQRRKKLALNHPVAQYIPEFNTNGKETVQLINLLTHTSGLPNDLATLEDVYQAKLSFQPGSKVAYHEMNFMLLPQIFEQVTGMELEAFVEDYLFVPLRMSNTEIRREESGRIKLFSTLSDLSHFAEMIENEGTFDYMRVLKKKAVHFSKQNFTSFLNESRGLGWEIEREGHSYGHRASNQLMWFYPKKNVHIVFHVDVANPGQRIDPQVFVALQKSIQENS